MKKFLPVLLLLIVSLFYGCATGNRMVKTYDAGYNYDRMYDATLAALNSMQYTVQQDGADSGYIRAVETYGVYTALAWGLFELLPLPYVAVKAPEFSIKLAKTAGGLLLDVTESTSNVLGNRIYTLVHAMEDYYTVLAGKRSLLEDGLNGRVDNSIYATTIVNNNNYDWENVTLKLLIMSSEGPKHYSISYPVIRCGSSQKVNFDEMDCDGDEYYKPQAKAFTYELTCTINGSKKSMSGTWTNPESTYRFYNSFKKK